MLPAVHHAYFLYPAAAADAKGKTQLEARAADVSAKLQASEPAASRLISCQLHVICDVVEEGLSEFMSLK